MSIRLPGPRRACVAGLEWRLDVSFAGLGGSFEGLGISGISTIPSISSIWIEAMEAAEPHLINQERK
jgi:hypothetical protein